MGAERRPPIFCTTPKPKRHTGLGQLPGLLRVAVEALNSVDCSLLMDTSVTPSTRVVVAAGQVSANLSGEQVILSMQDGVYYGLDPVGARIWAALHAPHTLDEVADMLVAEYDVDRARAMSDLVQLANALVERRLLEVVDGAAG